MRIEKGGATSPLLTSEEEKSPYQYEAGDHDDHDDIVTTTVCFDGHGIMTFAHPGSPIAINRGKVRLK
jgi:hypothetical protein